jgi:hypothetical protein
MVEVLHIATWTVDAVSLDIGADTGFSGNFTRVVTLLQKGVAQNDVAVRYSNPDAADMSNMAFLDCSFCGDGDLYLGCNSTFDGALIVSGPQIAEVVFPGRTAVVGSRRSVNTLTIGSPTRALILGALIFEPSSTVEMNIEFGATVELRSESSVSRQLISLSAKSDNHRLSVFGTLRAKTNETQAAVEILLGEFGAGGRVTVASNGELDLRDETLPPTVESTPLRIPGERCTVVVRSIRPSSCSFYSCFQL